MSERTRTTLRRFGVAGILLLGVAPGRVDGAGAPAPSADAGREFFESHVRPLLVDRCLECHGGAAARPKGGLRLDTRDATLRGGDSGKPAVVPGDVEGSLLIRAVRYGDPDLRMPPAHRLTAAQVKALETWVALGAPDPRVAAASPAPPPLDPGDFWAFKKPAEPAVPTPARPQWVRTPVDAFVRSALESKGLEPSPEADRRTLIRRATFDLTGLPPTPEEVEAFVAEPAADAYDRLVERLLASPHYGERWGRYWLDLARYSDTKGYVYRGEERTFVHAAHYRDWVVRALNEDMPYDRFLTLQIAADQLAPADGARLPQDLAATGFLTVGRRFLGVVPDIVDDRIDVVTRTTMGLTVACARCHDHKFDPIPTADYYSLYGVFAGSTERTVSLDDAPRPTPEYASYAKGYGERVKRLEDAVRAKTDELVSRLRTNAGDYLAAVPGAAKLPDDLFVMLLGPDDLNPAVVRQWQQYLYERAVRNDPVWRPWFALAGVPEADLAARGEPVLRAALADAAKPTNARVAAAFAGAKPGSMKEVAAVYGKLFADVNTRWLALTRGPAAAATSFPDPDEEAVRLVLYGPDSPARVPAGSVKDIEWFFDEPTRVQFGTLQAEVDRWLIGAAGAPPHAVTLVDRPEQKNPRVFKRGNPATKGEEVSRHFLSLVAGDDPPPFKVGSGRLELARAIASADNPLTARVMVNRIWANHFGTGIVDTPSDFGTRSDPPSHPELLDWLAVRFVKDGWSVKSVHRLIMKSATYRQSSADANPEGPKADPANRLLWRMNRNRLDFESLRDTLLAASGELDPTVGGKAGEIGGTRRTIYARVDRQLLPGVFRTFDFANPDLHIPQRAATTVPQQALFFMNAPFVSARAKALAARPVLADAKDDVDRVQRLYRLVYQRRATERQVAAGLRFIGAATREASDGPAVPKPASAWVHGHGSYDSAADRVRGFTPLPHFGGGAWQGGAAWPDPALGWVQLTAAGGHPGNDFAHAAVRRWVAPHDMTVRVDGEVRHDHAPGNGVAARIVSSRRGTLGAWALHNSHAQANVDRLEVKRGDTLDFVVDFAGDLNTDMFLWAPTVSELAPAAGAAQSWSAAADFAKSAPPDTAEPMGPWEAYAHALLLGNEFVFVD